MVEDDRDRVLLALSKRISETGWFPLEDFLQKRGTWETLDALTGAGAIRINDARQLIPKGAALRRIRDVDSFARDELDRAAKLLKYLQDELEDGRPGPHEIPALQSALGWAEPDDASRAVCLLWFELNTAGMHVVFSGAVPKSITANKHIWKTKPEDLLKGPPAIAEHHPTLDSEPLLVDLEGRLREMSNKIFIGHGASLVWRELKDFIRDRLKLPWEEFNRESTAGMATKERLEAMLDASGFAFLVMTPEDEHADGSKHARASVIHEVGLFQGRLGFRRAIVLLQEDCEEFSNIVGLTQIRFPKGKLSAAFEDVRRVLEREGLLSSEGASAGESRG